MNIIAATRKTDPNLVLYHGFEFKLADRHTVDIQNSPSIYHPARPYHRTSSVWYFVVVSGKKTEPPITEGWPVPGNGSFWPLWSI